MADSTSVGVLQNIFTAPSLAFSAIKERPNPWLPLLVLIIGTFAVQYTYMQVVDVPWLIDHQLQQAGTGQMTDAQRAQVVDATTRVPPSVIGAAQGLSTAIVILIVYAVVALYYLGVSFATNDGTKYKQWLALIAWCSLPGVLGIIASFVNLQVTDARFLPPEQLNPLSFGSLLGLAPEGATAVQRILMQLDVTVLWSIVLQITGYQAFTQRSVTFATAVVLGPLALIVLVVTLFALF